MVSRLTPAYSAPSLTVNQVFIRPSRTSAHSRTTKRVVVGIYAPRRAGDGCRRRGAGQWARMLDATPTSEPRGRPGVRAVRAAIPAIATVPHRVGRLLATSRRPGTDRRCRSVDAAPKATSLSAAGLAVTSGETSLRGAQRMPPALSD